MRWLLSSVRRHMSKTEQDRPTVTNYSATSNNITIRKSTSQILLPHADPPPDDPNRKCYGFKYKIYANINTASCSASVVDNRAGLS